MKPFPNKKKGKKSIISWKEQEHSRPAIKKLEVEVTWIKQRLYKDEIGIPALQAELVKKGIKVAVGTLRAFVKEKFEEELGRPVRVKEQGSAEKQLNEVVEDLEEAVFETNLSYSAINRNLENNGVGVSLGSLISFIKKTFYVDREPPRRFKKARKNK